MMSIDGKCGARMGIKSNSTICTSQREHMLLLIRELRAFIITEGLDESVFWSDDLGPIVSRVLDPGVE